jgi:hypothetical protein
MVFFSDTYVVGNRGHGSTYKVLGGGGAEHGLRNTTIDVELSKTLGATTPHPLLLLGVQSNSSGHGYATLDNWTQQTYQDDPNIAFRNMFGSSSSGGGSSDGASIAATRAQSVLDIQKAEIQALQGVLGASERERLDAHLDSIEVLERRIASASSGSGTSGSSSASSFNPTGFEYSTDGNSKKLHLTTVADLQMDLAVLALNANQTRVVSVMLGNHQSEIMADEWDWNNIYHQSIHGSSGDSAYIETRSYLTERLAYLIEKLRTTTDASGNPLLDSTLVVQVTDMGEGNGHTSDRAPMCLAGGGSAVQRGQVTTSGPHTNILDTVTELVGLTDTVPSYGSGALNSVIA